MMTDHQERPTRVQTPRGELPLHEYHVDIAGRRLGILHAGLIVTHENEQRFLSDEGRYVPFGIMLWPSAVALAYEIAARAEEFRGRSVMELGAGVGLPGLAAAALGASVLQTDRQEAALTLCRLNAERNDVQNVCRAALEWQEWDHTGTYDWIVGADILYSAGMRARLRRIFEGNLTAGGRILLADPFRSGTVEFLESMQADGWSACLTRWKLEGEAEQRPIGVYALAPPAG